MKENVFLYAIIIITGDDSVEEFKLRGVLTWCIDVEPNSKLGFNFPFKIVVPKKLNDSPELVYACNLPMDMSDNCSSFDELIQYAKNDFGSIDPMLIHLCLGNGYPMIIPAIPRFKDFRPNFLGSDCFKNDFKKSKNSKFKDYLYMYENLADQHKAMMEYAIEILNASGINVDDKLIISGYSEGAKFASHFALLHPEIIKAVIAGGTGGAISMPVSNIEGYQFTYPMGISDIQSFDFDAFKNISFFYYMGDADKSDSAIPNFEIYHYKNDKGEDCILKDECGNATPFIDENGVPKFILDSNGNYTAKFSLFSDQDVNAINKVLGTVTQDRFRKQESIYQSLRLSAIFKLYPGNHRTIFDNRQIIFEDVDKFINEYLKQNLNERLK